LSALSAGRALNPRKFLVLITVRGSVDPRSIVQLDVLGQLKKPMISSGLEPSDFRLVTYCPNFYGYVLMKSGISFADIRVPKCDIALNEL
jgi:hypothetical protein